ncbi:cobyrinate a,c-diamide synthase [Synechococcus sp. M16CYN]|uniref:cobyrinate a,c-diamide synthase n=1 Tax=Synechococcus sp. M16CYN TaxID=3103139 RepID=UPI003247DA37
MTVVIAAPASGSGKTLISMMLLSWARAQGESIQPFKVGPDYLDSQLLSAAAGRSCRNLDVNLCGNPWVNRAFCGYGGVCTMALVEGVMGLFDGIGSTEENSTAAFARLFNLPVVFVVNARGQAASLGALISGFRDHDPEISLAGVVINCVNNDRHRLLLEDVLDRLGVQLLGCIPRTDALQLPSQHLGLVPVHQLKQLEQRRQAWADLAKRHLDLKRLEPLLQAPTAGPSVLSDIPKNTGLSLPVAVATDAAFHFQYPETTELLTHLGMPILEWSPLANEAIPNRAKGLILPGGFPEQYAEQISHATRSLRSLRQFCQHKPVYAECGGMLLLSRQLRDLNDIDHTMANVLPFNARQGRLQVGYRHLRVRKDGLLVRRGEHFTGHELHHWEMVDRDDATGDSVLWQIRGWLIDQHLEGWSRRKLHASWVHLHWASRLTMCYRWRDALAIQS